MTISMDRDDDLPRKRFEHERLQYQWYIGYDRDSEYEKNPEWSTDIHTEETEVEDGQFTKPEVRFYNRFDPEHIWIRSDTTYDLTQTL